jgi:hypothetical protein
MGGPGFEAFSASLDGEFIVHGPAGELVPIRLTEVRRLPPVPNAPRSEPFALLFSGPAEPTLEQATHRVSHEGLGELDIFLVPVERSPAGALLYEAIFN